jgi:hypothetical protein
MVAAMDRATIEARLAQAEQHVARGAELVARQRALIRKLLADGHGTAEAYTLLLQFEETQVLHLADRDRLRAALAEISN